MPRATATPQEAGCARYFIASLKHTNQDHEHITFWCAEWNGYTPVLGSYAGEYTEEQARELNDGRDCIAIPVEAVRAIQSPEPYYKAGRRFYDQRGPVVDNTRANWNSLLAARLAGGGPDRPKPRVFRGRRTPTASAS